MERVVIEKLPDRKKGRGVKRWEEEKGEFVKTMDCKMRLSLNIALRFMRPLTNGT